MLENRIRVCDKCGTKASKCYPYNGQWLCKANCCLDEEMERDTGKHITDEQKLNEYRNFVDRTKSCPPSTY